MEIKEENKTDSDFECRICRCGNEVGELYTPCSCSGSVKFIHSECLVHWLKVSKKDSKCEICGSPFIFQKVYSPNAPSVLPFRLMLRGITESGRSYFSKIIFGSVIVILWGCFLPVITYFLFTATDFLIIPALDFVILDISTSSSLFSSILSIWFAGLLCCLFVLVSSIILHKALSIVQYLIGAKETVVVNPPPAVVHVAVPAADDVIVEAQEEKNDDDGIEVDDIQEDINDPVVDELTTAVLNLADNALNNLNDLHDDLDRKRLNKMTLTLIHKWFGVIVFNIIFLVTFKFIPLWIGMYLFSFSPVRDGITTTVNFAPLSLYGPHLPMLKCLHFPVDIASDACGSNYSWTDQSCMNEHPDNDSLKYSWYSKYVIGTALRSWGLAINSTFAVEEEESLSECALRFDSLYFAIIWDDLVSPYSHFSVLPSAIANLNNELANSSLNMSANDLILSMSVAHFDEVVVFSLRAIAYILMVALCVIVLTFVVIFRFLLNSGARRVYYNRTVSFIKFIYYGTKIAFIGLIDAVMLPLGIGLLIDLSLLSVCNASISLRSSQLYDNPIITVTAHWTIGIVFIFAVTSAGAELRSLVNAQYLKGYLPSDIKPTMSIYQLIKDRSLFQLFGGIIRGLLLCCVGVLFVITIPCNYGHLFIPSLAKDPLVFRFAWDASPNQIPFEIVIVHIFMPLIVERLWLRSSCRYVLRAYLNTVTDSFNIRKFVLVDASRQQNEHEEVSISEMESISLKFACLTFLGLPTLSLCISYLIHFPLHLGRHLISSAKIWMNYGIKDLTTDATYLKPDNDAYSFIVGVVVATLSWKIGSFIYDALTHQDPVQNAVIAPQVDPVIPLPQEQPVADVIVQIQPQVAVTSRIKRIVDIVKHVGGLSVMGFIWLGLFPVMTGLYLELTFFAPFRIDFGHIQALKIGSIWGIGLVMQKLLLRSIVVGLLNMAPADDLRDCIEQVLRNGLKDFDFRFTLNRVTWPVFLVIGRYFLTPIAICYWVIPWLAYYGHSTNFFGLSAIFMSLSLLARHYGLLVIAAADLQIRVAGAVVNKVKSLHNDLRDKYFLLGMKLKNKS